MNRYTSYRRQIINRISVIAVVFAMLISMSAVFCFEGYNSYAAQSGQITSDITNVNFRETPGGAVIKDATGNNIRLNGGQQLTVLDTSNSTWYKVSTTYQGREYTGYVAAQYVVVGTNQVTDTVQDTTQESTEAVNEEEITPQTADADFETALANEGFPESYKVLLREIHAQHPNWQFKAVQTGIDWNTLVSKETNKSGQVKNLVGTSTSYPHYNWRSTTVGYNWATDTWSPYDGKTWFAASDSFVTYYMDPRTYLYENYIFVFEKLSYQDGLYSEAGVESILAGSFMANTVPSGETSTYAQIILEASAQSGVSAYHLASRIKQEMGNSIGTSSSGTVQGYEGIYNFFNIGANDTANGSAAVNGLKWAATEGGSYGRPWNSVSKSIINGAKYLAASYISVGQDTLYTQKFNVTNRANLYSHQYMTNVQAPANEAPKTYSAYKANNILDNSLVFKIPVYANMPETAVSKPADSGNPNNWLKTLAIDGYGLTPTFTVSETTNYSLIVPVETASININASTVNSKAKITGAGTVNLNEGTNTIVINVTAENGSVRNYTLTVVRGNASAGNTVINGTQTNGSKGDLNGDGKISAADIVKLQRIIVGLDIIDSNTLALGDLNGDGKISAIDIVKIQRHIVGLETIQ